MENKIKIVTSHFSEDSNSIHTVFNYKTNNISKKNVYY